MSLYGNSMIQDIGILQVKGVMNIQYSKLYSVSSILHLIRHLIQYEF